MCNNCIISVFNAVTLCADKVSFGEVVLQPPTLTFQPKKLSDDSGVISKGRFFSFDDVHKMIDAGKIDEGQSITALYFIERKLGLSAG